MEHTPHSTLSNAWLQDSLKLKPKRFKHAEGGQQSTTRLRKITVPINIDSKNIEDTSSSSVSISELDSSASDSSIEVQREATRELPITALPFNEKEEIHNNLNSTLLDSYLSAPIEKVKNPLVSPIEEARPQKLGKKKGDNKKKGQTYDANNNVFDKMFRRSTPRHVHQMLSHLRRLKGQELSYEESEPNESSDEDWLSMKKNNHIDPDWLEPQSEQQEPLKSIAPKTYTPSSKLPLTFATLAPPTKKAILRCSSPNLNQGHTVKAKKALIEELEISSIVDTQSLDSSVELLPRGSTGGTVNSQEIAPFSSLSAETSKEEEEAIGSDFPVSPSASPPRKDFPVDQIALLPSPKVTPPKNLGKLACSKGTRFGQGRYFALDQIALLPSPQVSPPKKLRKLCYP